MVKGGAGDRDRTGMVSLEGYLCITQKPLIYIVFLYPQVSSVEPTWNNEP
jgi:hypothetical protein